MSRKLCCRAPRTVICVASRAGLRLAADFFAVCGFVREVGEHLHRSGIGLTRSDVAHVHSVRHQERVHASAVFVVKMAEPFEVKKLTCAPPGKVWLKRFTSSGLKGKA